jgi:hypothetical protein
LNSCSKTDFSIRISNQYIEEIDNVIINNNIKFGNLSVGQKSIYKPIEKGINILYGLTITGKNLYCNIELNGSGTHKWTITVQQTGDIYVSQDN